MLLEALLAITIFSISITGIVLALQSSSTLVQNVEREAWVQKQFKSVLTEALKASQSKEEFEERKVITLEDFGAEAVVDIIPSELESNEGEILNNLYDVIVTINWLQDNKKQEASLSTLHYYPLYQN